MSFEEASIGLNAVPNSGSVGTSGARRFNSMMSGQSARAFDICASVMES